MIIPNRGLFLVYHGAAHHEAVNPFKSIPGIYDEEVGEAESMYHWVKNRDDIDAILSK